MPISRSVSPPASGPSAVSCIGTSAAASTSGATPVGHQSCCSTTCLVSSAARSAASGSAPSRTAWTRDPNAAPAGSSAIGDTGESGGVPVRPSDAASVTSGASSSLPAVSCSLETPGASTPRISPEYDVLRHAASILRWKCRTSRSTGVGGYSIDGTGPTTDSSTTGPPAACQSPKRRIASESLTVAGLQRPGTSRSPIPRPRSNRDRPPLGSSHAGAHQATTWDCALVSAT